MARCKIQKSEYPFINQEEAAKFCHVLDMRCVEKKAPKLRKRTNKNVQLEPERCEFFL